MVCRCPRCVQKLGPQGDRCVPAAKCGAAGAPAPLSQNRSACRSREQRGIGSVCASALCCHPADLPLSTSLCPHGKNIGKPRTTTDLAPRLWIGKGMPFPYPEPKQDESTAQAEASIYLYALMETEP